MNRPSDVLDLLGPITTTILRIVRGEKRPIAKEWQKLRPTDMTPDYLTSFADGEARYPEEPSQWFAKEDVSQLNVFAATAKVVTQCEKED